jgi:hypothetical protein
MVPACAVREEEKRLVRLLANSVKKLSCKYSQVAISWVGSPDSRVCVMSSSGLEDSKR